MNWITWIMVWVIGAFVIFYIIYQARKEVKKYEEERKLNKKKKRNGIIGQLEEFS